MKRSEMLLCITDILNNEYSQGVTSDGYWEIDEAVANCIIDFMEKAGMLPPELGHVRRIPNSPIKLLDALQFFQKEHQWEPEDGES